jgi:hypothetical protein
MAGWCVHVYGAQWVSGDVPRGTMRAEGCVWEDKSTCEVGG